MSTDLSFFEFEGDSLTTTLNKEVETIDPMMQIMFEQTFKVSSIARPFSEGHILLTLELSPPNPTIATPKQSPAGDALHTILSHDLQVQVSAKFQFHENSSYLLVVNAGSPGTFIDQISLYITQTLLLELDIFNISLGGSFTLSSGENILQYYSGKTIIVLSNLFTYFGTTNRNTYELIHPVIAARLLNTDTSFLFLGLDDPDKLVQSWGQIVAKPLFPIDKSGADGSVHNLALNPFLETFEEVHTADKRPGVYRTHSMPVDKPFYKKRGSAVKSKAKKVAKTLLARYPLQTFIVTALPTDGSKKPPLGIHVHEALPLSARMLVSLIPCKSASGVLDSVFQYLIVASLPFDHRVRVFWEVSSKISTGEGIIPGFLRSPSSHIDKSTTTTSDIEAQVTRALTFDATSH